MVQATARRVSGYARPIVVCNEDHRFMIAEQLKQVNETSSDIILEPTGKNTAPAIALAAIQAMHRNANAIVVVLPADHLITDEAAFKAALTDAITLAKQEKLVAFGITPSSAEIGYGYIKANNAGTQPSPIAEFVEKPNLETAQNYIDSGDYFWNSGMFVFKASRYLEELGKWQAEILNCCTMAFEKAATDLDFIRVDKEAFAACPADSIDYAIMEKTDAAWVVPSSPGWSDLGAWDALWEVSEKDSDGNVQRGDIISQECKNCFFDSETQLLAAIGLEDIVAVSTKDALLIAPKDRVQDVKKIVDRIQNSGRSEHLLHREVHRPWGSYDSIENGERFQVKRITVKPGGQLSLQMHYHRAEHWIVVKGTALVQRGKEEILLSENESVYIPLGETHRLSNPGNMPLQLIEVQSGSYLGEDDIVRFEDQYKRD